MIYRGRGLRPYSLYERRKNPRFMSQDIAFQPVEAEKKEQTQKEIKHEPAYAESQPGNAPFRQPVSNERINSNDRCPHICKIFNIDIFLDDLILLGLILLLLQESCDDYIFIFALIFLFLIGKE